MLDLVESIETVLKAENMTEVQANLVANTILDALDDNGYEVIIKK